MLIFVEGVHLADITFLAVDFAGNIGKGDLHASGVHFGAPVKPVGKGGFRIWLGGEELVGFGQVGGYAGAVRWRLGAAWGRAARRLSSRSA